jgi:hypothetical protein
VERAGPRGVREWRLELVCWNAELLLLLISRLLGGLGGLSPKGALAL